MSFTAIDFEASCLPRHGRSFPIEIGIADDRGTRAWLIRPRPEWLTWGWTARAESLHGISRAMLERDGLPADRVAAELADAVRGRRLVADSVLDGYWLTQLAMPAGRATLPKLDQVADIMSELATTDAEIEAACATLAAEPFHRHRAAEDARWLFRLVEALCAASHARAATTKDRPIFAWPTDKPATQDRFSPIIR